MKMPLEYENILVQDSDILQLAKDVLAKVDKRSTEPGSWQYRLDKHGDAAKLAAAVIRQAEEIARLEEELAHWQHGGAILNSLEEAEDE